MNIYKQIAKDLKEINATQDEERMAFIALSISGIDYLKYVDKLKAQRKKQEEEPTDA